MSDSSAPGQIRNLTAEQMQEVLRLANIIYFRNRAHERTSWMGVKTMKCPMDMWIYQELIVDLGIDLLIETGSFRGGSALYFAHLFDAIGEGRVISIDVDADESRPAHGRIEYVPGSSVDRSVFARVEDAARRATAVMVVLDSDHKVHHKLEELELYSRLVTRGSYIVAEDSCFDYFPAWPEFGPGPAAAVRDFVRDNPAFEVDRSPEKHLITFAPAAFLKRVS